MSHTFDELAGIVELFGALSSDELREACAELAFKSDGAAVDSEAFEAAVEEALEAYALVETDDGDETLLLAGPTAFPTLPANAGDLPHILDVERRSIDRTAVGATVLERIECELDDGLDPERADALLDVTYDLEAWAALDASAVREALDAVRET